MRQVKEYLRENLDDPGSCEYIKWHTVITRPDSTYSVRCRFRAKNRFGGYVAQEWTFRLDKNGAVYEVDE